MINVDELYHVVMNCRDPKTLELSRECSATLTLWSYAASNRFCLLDVGRNLKRYTGARQTDVDLYGPLYRLACELKRYTDK
jgi:hypothetical protein